MTTIYFVRHAQSDHRHADDRTRPLTEAGLADRGVVLDCLRDVPVDAFYGSPYRRSYDTIAPAAAPESVAETKATRARTWASAPNSRSRRKAASRRSRSSTAACRWGRSAPSRKASSPTTGAT